MIARNGDASVNRGTEARSFLSAPPSPCSRTPFKIFNNPDIETILNILYTLATKANIKYFERRHSMWTNAYSYEDIGEFLREARRARGAQGARRHTG